MATLAENLAREIPEISELYLFGSRARGTTSSRSDADVLVVADSYIKPLELRKFSEENCNALDLFIVDEGKATSSQNESFIRAENFSSLISTLGAIKIWSRKGGRAKANIEWRFKVKRDVAFSSTVLPNIDVMSPADSLPTDPSQLAIKDIIGNLTTPQIWNLLLAVVGAMIAIGGVGYWLGQQNLNENKPVSTVETSVETTKQ
ncbi:MAG: nucleotidyltransferase domain-containing protein [Alphaproteobacteria bacterium]